MISAGLVIFGYRGCNMSQGRLLKLSADYERCYGVLGRWWGCQIFAEYNRKCIL